MLTYKAIKIMRSLSLAMIIAFTQLCSVAAAAGDIRAQTGFIILQRHEAMLGSFPAPPSSLTADGNCRQSAVPISSEVREAAGWTKPGYDSWLALWAAYHFGARATTSRGGRCQDGEFAARAWQAALGQRVDGQLTVAQASRFVELMDSNHESFRAARKSDELKARGMASNEAFKVNTMAGFEKMEASFEVIWDRLVKSPDGPSTFPREMAPGAEATTLDLLDHATRDTQELAKAWVVARAASSRSRAPFLEQKLRIDAEKLPLGESRAFFLKALPRELCSDEEPLGYRVCRGTGLEDTCSELRLAKPKSSSRLAESIPSLARKSTEVMNFIEAQYDNCQRDLDRVTSRGTNVQLAGVPVVLGLKFERGVLSTMTILPREDAHLVERWISARFGEALIDRETRTQGGVPYSALCDAWGGCTVQSTPQWSSATENRTWRKGRVRVTRRDQQQFIVELLDLNKPTLLDIEARP